MFQMVLPGTWDTDRKTVCWLAHGLSQHMAQPLTPQLVEAVSLSVRWAL